MRVAPRKARRNRIASVGTSVVVGLPLLVYGYVRLQNPLMFYLGWVPAVMERKHLELYAMLECVFQQEPGAVLTSTIKSILLPYPRKVGRNAPCPCGSGEKFKRCCLGG